MEDRNYYRGQMHDYRNNSKKRHVRYVVDKTHSNKRPMSVSKILSFGAALIATTYGLVSFFPSMFSSKKMAELVTDTSITAAAPEYTIPAFIDVTDPKLKEKPIHAKKQTHEKASTAETQPVTEKKKNQPTEPIQEPVINTIFTVGGNGDEEVKAFLGSESDGEYNADGSVNLGYYVYKYSEDYGVDPNVIASMCYQETGCDHYSYCPDGELYSGVAVGILQLESPASDEQSATKVTAYNYTTGQWDTVAITMDNACSATTNIQIGCMLFQNSIEYFEGNLTSAIQSHNYSQGMVDLILYRYYSDYETLKKDYPNIIERIKEQYPTKADNILSDITKYWDIIKPLLNTETTTVPLDAFYDAHYNPLKYISGWSYDTYGDGQYIEHVLSHSPQSIVKYRANGYEYTVNMKNMEVLDKKTIGSKTM